MTGYGKASGNYNGKKIVVEIRSLNSKGLDLNARIASLYREKELDIRKIVGSEVDRGKAEININVENTGTTANYVINKPLAEIYFKDMQEIAKSTGQTDSDLLGLVMRMPEIYINNTEEVAEEEWNQVFDLVKEALVNFTAFRTQEGESLQQDFEERIGKIDELLQEVPKYESLRIDTIKERMRKGLEDNSSAKPDENRFEQELIYYIEKLDVTEEKVRLSNHLNYFIETMKTGKSVGKKLGFITQEIGREINTLGSKSYHAELQKVVVEMKDNLEKIKEQVLNTL